MKLLFRVADYVNLSTYTVNDARHITMKWPMQHIAERRRAKCAELKFLPKTFCKA